MSNKYLGEHIRKVVSPNDLKKLKENISENFYITYIDNIYDIHYLIQQYCQETGALIYDKENDVNKLYDYIKGDSPYFSSQLEIQIRKKKEEQELEKLKEEDEA